MPAFAECGLSDECTCVTSYAQTAISLANFYIACRGHDPREVLCVVLLTFVSTIVDVVWLFVTAEKLRAFQAIDVGIFQLGIA